MTAIARLYEELYNLAIIDDPLRLWLRGSWDASSDQYALVRIWNGRAPKGYEPRLLTIGEPNEEADAATETFLADGNQAVIRLHLFTELDGRYYVGAIGVEHLHRVFHRKPMELDGFTLIDGVVRYVTANEDPDGKSYHTIAEYRASVAAVA
jgi:hypothetical protein